MDDFRLLPDRARRAVGQSNAVFQAAGCFSGQGLTERFFDHVPFLGMHGLQKGGMGGDKFMGSAAEDAEDAVRPPEGIIDDVPVPVAEFGNFLGFFHTAADFFQLDGPASDPFLEFSVGLFQLAVHLRAFGSGFFEQVVQSSDDDIAAEKQHGNNGKEQCGRHGQGTLHGPERLLWVAKPWKQQEADRQNKRAAKQNDIFSHQYCRFFHKL